jgi:hypothetical protein
MYKSNPIPMIRENTQMNVVKLSACYQYKTSGKHDNVYPPISENSIALTIDFYGIDKDGEHLIAKCPLKTSTGYAAKNYASSIVECIPSIEYPYVYFAYDKSLATDFLRMNSLSNLFVEVKEVSDIQPITIVTDAT